MGPKINIDAAGIAAQFKEMAVEVQQDIEMAVQELAKMAHQHIANEAAQGPDKLHSSLTTYQEALSKPQLLTPGVWVITLDESALWIEDGMEEHDMKKDLLKGTAFKVIPFDQNKRPQDRTKGDIDIMGELKAGLNAINARRKADGLNKINLSKIEKNFDGSPRVSDTALHRLNIPSSLPTANAKNPALKGLAIYQKIDKDTGNVRRDVLTFRTVSKNSDPDSWHHPAFKAKKFFDKAEDWAWNEWETKILPEILSRFK